MHSEVTIIVSRLEWCCIPCQVVNKHGVSIDEHLKSCHVDLISLASATLPCPSPDLEVGDFKENCLDLSCESVEKTNEEFFTITVSTEPVHTGEVAACETVECVLTTEVVPFEQVEESVQTGEVAPCERNSSVEEKETIQPERNESVSGAQGKIRKTTRSPCKRTTRNAVKFPADVPDPCDSSQCKVRTRSSSRLLANALESTAKTTSKNDTNSANSSVSPVEELQPGSQEVHSLPNLQKTEQSVHRLTVSQTEIQEHPDGVDSVGEKSSGTDGSNVKSVGEGNSGKDGSIVDSVGEEHSGKDGSDVNSLGEEHSGTDGSIVDSAGEEHSEKDSSNVYSIGEEHSGTLRTDGSDVDSAGEEPSGKADKQCERKPRARRKRPRQELVSWAQDVPWEELCKTQRGPSKVEYAGNSTADLKSPGLEGDVDDGVSAPKKHKKDPDYSEKPKQTRKGKLKMVNREMGLHLKTRQVNRSQTLTAKEMQLMKLGYGGCKQSKKSNSTKRSVRLSAAKGNSKRQIAVENERTVVVDSNSAERNNQSVTSDEVLVFVPEIIIPGEQERQTEVSKRETSNAGLVKEVEIVPQTPFVADAKAQATSVVGDQSGQNSHALIQETSWTVTAVHNLPVVDTSDVQVSDDDLKNIPQADSACSQQDESKALNAVKDEQFKLENNDRSAKYEKWVKSRTIKRVSKEKAPTSFEPPSKVHECTTCHAKFSTAENLSDHVSKMSTHEPSECRHCQRSFHCTYDLNFHVFEDHERRTQPFCFECGETFQNLATFEKHLHQHKYDCELKLLDMAYHLCSICQTDVPCRYEVVQKHYNKHKMATCCECFVQSKLVLLPSASSVKEHLNVHFNFCNICFQNFPSVEAFDEHCPCQSENARQEDGQGKVCGRCSQWCPNKALATLHLKEHKLLAVRKWQVEKQQKVCIPCIYCDKILNSRANVTRHIAQMHSGPRIYKYQCEFCGKGVDYKSALKDHIANHHLGIKRHVCEYCDQSFVSASTFKRHILKEHDIDKQYKCEECGERFYDLLKLNRHVVMTHSGSSRFLCEHCGKSCDSRSAMRRHAAIHEEKRVFTCQYCGVEYKRRDHLTRHIKKCFGPKPEKAQAEGSGTLSSC